MDPEVRRGDPTPIYGHAVSILSHVLSFQEEVDKRWKLIQKALSNCKFQNFNDIKDTILSYNAHYASKWNFDGLREYIENVSD